MRRRPSCSPGGNRVTATARRSVRNSRPRPASMWTRSDTGTNPANGNSTAAAIVRGRDVGPLHVHELVGEDPLETHRVERLQQARRDDDHRRPALAAQRQRLTGPLVDHEDLGRLQPHGGAQPVDEVLDPRQLLVVARARRRRPAPATCPPRHSADDTTSPAATPATRPSTAGPPRHTRRPRRRTPRSPALLR